VNNALMFSKASDEWSTPQDVFDALDREFGFELDAAASRTNAKCCCYLGPDHHNPLAVDALGSVSWAEIVRYRPSKAVFLNPPYSKVGPFMLKAKDESLMGATVVCLVPSRTDTKWWHSVVWDQFNHQPCFGVQIRFIKGRLKFGEGKNSAPFPSVVVIFRPPADPEAGTDTGLKR
jgi:phage N-6-adenine-methyltransferase